MRGPSLERSMRTEMKERLMSPLLLKNTENTKNSFSLNLTHSVEPDATNILERPTTVSFFVLLE